MAERIAMRPLIPYHAVPDLMATADAGIVAKRANSFGNEAFSTKVMEYMTQSVPVIVARTAIDTYYFDDSIVLFFASGNVDELADCMRRMMDDAGLRERLTTNAQQYVARHGWRPLRDTYFDIVDGTRGQPSARQDKAATQGAE